MKIITYENFKKDYEYRLLNEIELLKTLPFKTFNSDLLNDSKNSLKRITSSNRPKRDRDLTVKIEYIKYLENFLIEDPRNFDHLYNLMTEKVILIDDLREINNVRRKTII